MIIGNFIKKWQKKTKVNETKDGGLNLKGGGQGQKYDYRERQRGCQGERGDTGREMRRNGAECVSETQLKGESPCTAHGSWTDQKPVPCALTHRSSCIQKSFLLETQQRSAVATKLQFFSPGRSGVQRD